jgi:C4-dicarboxylate-specific signal transduction histidine kinase
MEETLRRARDELEGRTRELAHELVQVREGLMTERARRIGAEAALRETQKELACSSRRITVAELTASIAHQINQPLAVVVANGEAARNWLRRSPPVLPAAVESIEAAVKEAVRASEIVARLRSLFAKSVPRQTNINVNELIGEVLTLAAPDLAKREIVTECRLAAALPPIFGDRVQLQQVLLNVVNNASDAMDGVAERRRELIVETKIQGSDTISIVVSDSGRGISAVDQTRIFQPFYSTKDGGMGIGLSVSRTIVEQHGGSIRAMPRQPHGAILRVDIPRSVTPRLKSGA